MARTWLRRWKRCVFGTNRTLQRRAAPARPSVLNLEERVTPSLFGQPTFSAADTSPRAVAVADVTGDGKPDIIVANYGTAAGGTISVLSGAAGFTGQSIGLSGLNPVAVAIADVNNDGKLDIISANANSNDIAVLLGGGNGTFQPARRFAVGTNQVGLTLGDFNHDGKIDVAVVRNPTPTSSVVTVLLGTGTNAIFPNTGGTTFTVSNTAAATQIVSADFSLDGKLDLAVSTTNGLSILRGTNVPTAGSFTAATSFDAGDNLVGLAVGDVNGDSKPDIVTAGSKGTSLFENTSSIGAIPPPPGPTFGFTQVTFPVVPPTIPPTTTTDLFPGFTPTAVTVADLNGDGKPDVAIAYPGTYNAVTKTGKAGGVAVLLGHGDLTFESKRLTFPFPKTDSGVTEPTTSATPSPVAIAASDVNRDGQVDLVTANAAVNAHFDVTVLLNTSPPTGKPAFTPPGGGTGIFAAPRDFVVGTTPLFPRVADVNGDGNPDLIVPDYGGKNVSVLLGDGRGNFLNAVGTPVGSGGTGPVDVEVADFNGDGFPDLAVTNFYTNTLAILLGNGTGQFSQAPGSPIGVGTYPVNCVIADFNGDGNLDIATVNEKSNDVSILLGNGDGTFKAPASVPAGSAPFYIVAGDFNNDGNTDLAVTDTASPNGNNVTVLLGNGDGTFTAAVGPAMTVGGQPETLTTADFNGDGNMDLAVSAPNGPHGNGMYIFLGNGDGTFTQEANTPFAVGTGAIHVVTGDVNEDGIPDLVVTNSTGVNVLLGRGDGSFKAGFTTFGGSGPFGVSLADVNKDGHLDLEVANETSNKVSVLFGLGDGTFQQLPQATPLPTPVSSPRHVVLGDINGDGKLDALVVNLGAPPTIPSNVSVMFGDGNGGFAPPPPAVPPATQIAATLSPGTTPADIQLADVNGDGKLDVIVANYGSKDISVFLGNGDGSFGSAITTSTTSTGGAIALTVGDFNHDGKLDVATSDYGASEVSILLGNGDGTFTVHTPTPTPPPNGFGIGVPANPGPVPPATPASNTFNAYGITTADVNGDGNPDLIVAYKGVYGAYSGGVSVLLGDGAGNFRVQVNPASSPTAPTPYPVPGYPVDVAVGDVNGDGKPDIVTANLYGGTASVLLNNGNGTFGAVRTFSVGGQFASYPQQIKLADVDGDGNLDIVVADGANNDVVVLRGRGDGTFLAGQGFYVSGELSTGGGPPGVAVGDVNGDGVMDVVTANGNAVNVASQSTMTSVLGERNAATSLQGIPASVTTTAGVSFSFTVNALTTSGIVPGLPDTRYTGTIHFTSDDPQNLTRGGLPADATYTLSDTGTLTFNATMFTAGVHHLTFTDTTDPSITGTITVTVNPAAPSQLVISGYPSPTTAGVAHSFTVTALDPFGNVATGYTGTVHFTSTDAQAGLPADYTFTGAGAGKDNGVHTFNATLVTGGTQSITATDTKTATITASQTGITVRVAASMTVSGYPSPTIAGASHTFTVTVFDQFGAVADGYVGTIHFTSSDPQAILPADYTFTGTGAGKDNGVHTFSATLKTAPTQSITVTDTVNGATGSQTGIVVQPLVPTKVTVTGFPNPSTAGVAGNFTVTAVDQFGNLSTVYTGTVHFTSSDPQAVLPADYTFTGTDAGVHVFSATLKTVGSQTITATDTTTGSINGSQTVTVTPAAADHFTVTGYPSPNGAGVAGSVTVHAFDPFGNTDTNYAGTVHFTSTDPQAVLPADYTFVAATDQGVHTFNNIVFKTTGTQSLTAADVNKGGPSGVQSGIVVTPAAPATFTIVAGSGQKARINAAYGTAFQVLVKDAFGNPVPGVSVTFTAPSAGASGKFAGGTATATVTTDATGKATAPAYTANGIPGKYTLTATTAGLSPLSFALLNSEPLYAVGADGGATPYVSVYDATTGRLKFQFYAFDPAFRGGVRVAVADVNGDGVSDIVCAAGPGGGPHVRVFDGVTGIQLPGAIGSFNAYAQAFTGGVFVAAADVNNDGFADIITGAGAGAGPDVSVFDGKTGTRIHEFYAQAPNFTGGVPVAAGDVNGDGFADVIAGAAAGGAPAVLIYNGNSTSMQLPRLSSFFAYSTTFSGGVWVGAGDTNGDGKAEVITGMGPGKGSAPEVRTFNGVTGAMLSDFFAFPTATTGAKGTLVANTAGVRVAGFDFNGDGFADIIAGQGPGQGPQTRIFDGRTDVQLTEFNGADPTFLGGIWVGGG